MRFFGASEYFVFVTDRDKDDDTMYKQVDRKLNSKICLIERGVIFILFTLFLKCVGYLLSGTW